MRVTLELPNFIIELSSAFANGCAPLLIDTMRARTASHFLQGREVNKPLVFQNLPYGSLDRQTLDLYLPSQQGWSSRYSEASGVPLVVFVHGGGWRRGNKQAWRYYFSCQDTNLFAALYMWYVGLYGNVGEAFARRGIPCAVINYRLGNLTGADSKLEAFVSTTVSFCTFVFPVTALHYSWKAYSTLLSSWESVVSPGTSDLGSAPAPGHSAVPLILAASAIAYWFALRISSGHLCLTPRIHLGALCSSAVAALVVIGLSRSPQAALVAFALSMGIAAVRFHARAQARQGVTKFPQQLEDVALAANWGVSESARNFLGLAGSALPVKTVLAGHSAGAHLSSVLACTPGLRPAHLAGVLCISGIYNVEEQLTLSSLLERFYLKPIFTMEEAKKDGSPSWLIEQHGAREREEGGKGDMNSGSREVAPRWMIATAEYDATLVGDADKFKKRLDEVGDEFFKSGEVERVVAAGTNHFGVIVNFGRKGGTKDLAERSAIWVESVIGLHQQEVSQAAVTTKRL
jgi:acetyl esterase/lipase